MPFTPIMFLDEKSTSSPTDHATLNAPGWIAINEHTCTFRAKRFRDVALNLIKNPNINSANLVRADIFYDSHGDADAEPTGTTVEELKTWSSNSYNDLAGLKITRRIIRQLIPRNPQLDRPVAQTCLLLESNALNGEVIVILIPHVSRAEDLPWYHSAVQACAYRYQSQPLEGTGSAQDPQSEGSGKISVHYQLFPDQELPLSNRLLQTANSLLQVLYKHGQRSLTGYLKNGQHDQIITQKRVQDSYTDLKAKHAERLCSAWVEQTEPSKHIYEDLGIAAFLIELWKDMYAPPGTNPLRDQTSLPPFPGFVDIGCGNGVLTEILILSGYPGEGFDGRRRKTWSILSLQAQSHLHETLCVPQPLFDLYPPPSSPSNPSSSSKPSLLARARAIVQHPSERQPASSLKPPSKPWHNGLFPARTFIISNHADELTPWTPLLACLTQSPFLAIPCCPHNLSGARFRAPSAYNANTADAAAPSYFAGQRATKGAKSVPIVVPTHLEDDEEEGSATSADSTAASPLDAASTSSSASHAADTGDLRALAPSRRAAQPSAYAALCDWVSHLASLAGFEVERDQLRIPSTRNLGLVGRVRRPAGGSSLDGETEEMRRDLVRRIVQAEGADGIAWVRRCEEVLAKGGGEMHGRE